jgi:N-acetylglucosamine-6-phosphate deacetylase
MTMANEHSLLTNARLVLAGQVIDRGSLLVAAGRIERIIPGDTSGIDASLVRYDLSGRTLFPGFIDVHIHGAVGVDVMEARVDGLERVSQFLATQGVTAWLPTLVPGTLEQYKQSISTIAQLVQAQRENSQAFLGAEAALAAVVQQERWQGCLRSQGWLSTSGARALGVHYEGPFVNSEQCGALHDDHFRTFSSEADLDALATLSERDAIHFMTVAPEIAGGIELARELSRRGWIVSIGHTRASVDVLDQAADAGARHMTHFMNAMAPLHHRAPGPVGWGLSRDDVTCDFIADGVHLDPFMLRLLLRLKAPDRLSLISDAIAAAGMGDGDYQIWGETISVKDGRTSNARGSIAGSVITMLDAVKMMLRLGVSETDAAWMAATNPARLLRIDRDYGSIAEGKRADLVALDADGEVRLTMVGGRVAYEKK